MAEALKVLELAGVLTWAHRIARIQVRERDLFGRWASRWRVIRTSNAYVFRDPQQRPEGVPASKSENRSGTQNQEILRSCYCAGTRARPGQPARARSGPIRCRDRRQERLRGPAVRQTEGRKTLMNKKRVEKAVPAASRVAEALARAANAEPWEPMPGMIKRQCPQCRYWFASNAETGLCPDCSDKLPREGGRRGR